MATGDPLRVTVHYDFASSLCFVADRVLARLAGFVAEIGLELVWSPLDLAQLTGWRAGEPLAPDRLAEVRAIAASLGVAVRLPDRWHDSRDAAAAAVALLALAGEGGDGREGGERGRALEAGFRERIFTHVYEQGGEVDEPGLVARTLAEMGRPLTGADLAAGASGLDARTAAAARGGVVAVPALVLGEFPFSGIHDEATMRSLLGRFAARRHGRERPG